MIGLMDVNTIAAMASEYVAEERKDKCGELVPMLDSRLADKRDVLAKLEAYANERDSDNAWNKYESAGEAYAYGEQLRELLDSFINDMEEWDDMGWQLQDIYDSTKREWEYRMERAQW